MAIQKTWYHGSKSAFKQFTQKGSGQHGEGFYFASSFQDASIFASTLAGNGDREEPRVYTVNIRAKRPLNTMSVEDCKTVARFYGFEFRPLKNVGGPKEHYYYLARQLKAHGLGSKSEINDRIQKVGFDAIYYEFMNHLIVFNEDQISIENVKAV